jgi:saxitoxin biosynthesis operon SxtJ-like protein
MTSAGHSKVAPAPHRWRPLGTVYIAPPPAPTHRSFGLMVGGVLVALAAFTLWRGHTIRAEVLGAIGAVLIVAGLVRPSSLAGLATAWGKVGHALGWFNSRVLLTVMFVLILWPIGFLNRLFGNDPLERRKSGSMWTPYPERLRDPKHFERLF